MKEQPTQSVMSEEEKLAQLNYQFDNLTDEIEIVHGVITGELFRSGVDGERKVLERITKLKGVPEKDAAYFRLAQLVCEEEGNVDVASGLADRIIDQNERARCLVHLASFILQKRGELQLADRLFQKIGEDGKGYGEYYMKLRKDFE